MIPIPKLWPVMVSTSPPPLLGSRCGSADVAKPTGECGDHAVFGLVLPTTRPGGQAGPRAHLGQRHEGLAVSWSVPGCIHTTGRSSRVAKASAFSRACCQPRVAFINPIEAKWVHGKKNVVEADRLLTASELESRVYAYFACSPESRLCKPAQVA
jgi:hypothetical protein